MYFTYFQMMAYLRDDINRVPRYAKMDYIVVIHSRSCYRLRLDIGVFYLIYIANQRPSQQDAGLKNLKRLHMLQQSKHSFSKLSMYYLVARTYLQLNLRKKPRCSRKKPKNRAVQIILAQIENRAVQGSRCSRPRCSRPLCISFYCLADSVLQW